MSSSRRGLFRNAARSAAKVAVENVPVPEAEPQFDLDRYGRQLLLDGWGAAEQRAVRDASVLIVGAGALGSPVGAYLAGAGVGRIGVLDHDRVELSNLHRQFLHSTPELGFPKAYSAVAKLQVLNPDVMIEPYQVRLDADNAEGLVLGCDLIVDCSDSFATRYLVNATCCANGVPLVEGGVLGLAGLVMAIRPGQTACYRCAFPSAPPNAATCATEGVLGPTAGVVGSLMAMEALKLLAGLPDPLTDAFLQVDLARHEYLRVSIGRRDGCPDCG